MATATAVSNIELISIEAKSPLRAKLRVSKTAKAAEVIRFGLDALNLPAEYVESVGITELKGSVEPTLSLPIGVYTVYAYPAF